MRSTNHQSRITNYCKLGNSGQAGRPAIGYHTFDMEPAASYSDRIETLLHCLALTLDDAVDGDALASYACLSRFYFQRLFVKSTGESPGRMRRRLLLERAAYLLEEARTDVTELAFDSGYESLEGFSRAFRKAYGISPSHYRRLALKRFRIPSRNGIHYDPQTRGIGVRRRQEESIVDLTDRLIDHDAWLTRRLMERAKELTDTQLDAELPAPQNPLPFESPELTLRKALDRLVFTKEVWVAAVRGVKLPEESDSSLPGMTRRMDVAFAQFNDIVREVRDEAKWDESFVDDVCVPAETFTFGGMIAHVITFSAFRRITVIRAMTDMGLSGLGYGDPIEWERKQEEK